MHLSWIDWSIIAISIISLRFISLSTRRYTKSVGDFLAADRSAGRYLLTIASQMGAVGIVTFVGGFEQILSTGLASGWWSYMVLPLLAIISLSGWVAYRFRETRALTMAQFFEMRYNRRFRIFAGILCFLSGVINFGIFPAVAARFFVYYCGLPEDLVIPLMGLHVPTFAVVMMIDMGLALGFVTMGGQVSVMVTECVQGIFCALAFVVIAAVILVDISWPEMTRALSMAPAGKSMLNPFDTSKVGDWNIWFNLILMVNLVYNHMSWQGSSGFNSAARTPHEQKMGSIIGFWRSVPQGLALTVIPLATLVIMRLPEYASKAAMINSTLHTIPNKTIQGEMMVPIAMACFLPAGIKGLLATVVLFYSFTSHDTCMHSWGSIFVQDVYLPIRNKTISPQQHVKLLRYAIIGVAIFACIFSLLYKPTEKLAFFCAITGMIWMGGSGAAIIGGLYTRWGTTAGAYSGLIVGAVLGIARLIIPEYYLKHTGHEFPVNGMWSLLIGIIFALSTYVVVSFMTGGRKRAVDLDKILHRGKYKVLSDEVVALDVKSRWMQYVGITQEFSKSDRFLAFALIGWNGLHFVWFVVFSTINLLTKVPLSSWANWWHVHVMLYTVLSVPLTIWFTIGGITDIKALLVHLTKVGRDNTDDGQIHSVPETSKNESVEALLLPDEMNSRLEDKLKVSRDE